MNIVSWVLAGGAIAWINCIVLQRNAARGAITSIVIGTLGAIFGGQVLAPIFGAAMGTDFNPFALFVACASAVACLSVSNIVHRRYGV